MSNYFQKITSRSTGVVAENPEGNSSVLPQRPFSIYEPNAVFTEENDHTADPLPEPGAVFNSTRVEKQSPNEITHDKNQPLQSIQEIKQIIFPGNDQKNDTSPSTTATPSLAIQKKTDHDVISHEIAKPQQDLSPVTTVIERINQRNLQSTIIEKQNAERDLPSGVNTNTVQTDIGMKGRDNILQPQKSKSGEEKKAQQENIHSKKLIQPLQPSPELKSPILSLQNENVQAVPVKNKKENKLVIGRITVEVINQVLPAAKKEPPRQNNTVKAAGPQVSHINKLSFGLSQL